VAARAQPPACSICRRIHASLRATSRSPIRLNTVSRNRSASNPVAGSVRPRPSSSTWIPVTRATGPPGTATTGTAALSASVTPESPPRVTTTLAWSSTAACETHRYVSMFGGSSPSAVTSMPSPTVSTTWTGALPNARMQVRSNAVSRLPGVSSETSTRGRPLVRFSQLVSVSRRSTHGPTNTNRSSKRSAAGCRAFGTYTRVQSWTASTKVANGVSSPCLASRASTRSAHGRSSACRHVSGSAANAWPQPDAPFCANAVQSWVAGRPHLRSRIRPAVPLLES